MTDSGFKSEELVWTMLDNVSSETNPRFFVRFYPLTPPSSFIRALDWQSGTVIVQSTVAENLPSMGVIFRADSETEIDRWNFIVV